MRAVRARIEAGTGIMSSTPRVPSDDVVRCPHCQGDLSFVGSWACRGLWGYKDVRTYECRDHGPIFVSPETAIARGQNIASASGPDDGDRDSLVSAPRKPTPTINADAIAIPEPESSQTDLSSAATARGSDAGPVCLSQWRSGTDCD